MTKILKEAKLGNGDMILFQYDFSDQEPSQEGKEQKEDDDIRTRFLLPRTVPEYFDCLIHHRFFRYPGSRIPETYIRSKPGALGDNLGNI